MSAMATFSRHAFMARRSPDWKPHMREDATQADAALRRLVGAAEDAAAELIRAGKPAAGHALLSAATEFRDVPVDTSGVLRGNADLVPAQHTYLQPGDRL